MCTKSIRGRMSIDTLDRRLDWYSIDVLIDTRSTLDRHLINSRSKVRRVSADLYASIKNKSTVDRLSTKMPMECRWNVDQGVDGASSEYRSIESLSRADRWYRSTLDRGCL